jgi:hypothetical protein
MLSNEVKAVNKDRVAKKTYKNKIKQPNKFSLN